jgi:hypothetical protein
MYTMCEKAHVNWSLNGFSCISLIYSSNFVFFHIGSDQKKKKKKKKKKDIHQVTNYGKHMP